MAKLARNILKSLTGKWADNVPSLSYRLVDHMPHEQAQEAMGFLRQMQLHEELIRKKTLICFETHEKVLDQEGLINSGDPAPAQAPERPSRLYRLAEILFSPK